MDDHEKKKHTSLYESARPFSQSVLWQLNKEYYQQLGIDAWSQGPVPHHISSNARVGRMYAEMIMAFAADADPAHKTQVQIIELGAGHGRLGFHVLRELGKKRQAHISATPAYRYVMSDVSKANLEYLSDHPQLQHFYAEGRLDLALIDADEDGPVHLLKSGDDFADRGSDAPLIIIANYFFDSIASDLWYVKAGTAHQCMLELHNSAQPASDRAADILLGISSKYSVLTELTTPYYVDRFLDRLIQRYTEGLSESFVSIPTASIRVIDRMRALTTRPMMVIAMDKGVNDLKNLDKAPPPDLVKHGSISFAVNLDAMSSHCGYYGGVVMQAPSPHLHLQVMCLTYGQTELQRSRHAYGQVIDDFKVENLDHIKALVYAHIAVADLAEVIAMLKLFASDHGIFQRILPRVKQLVGSMTHHDRFSMTEVLVEVAESYMHIGEKDDLLFEVAGLLYQLGQYPVALTYFERSEKIFGTTADGYYNRMLCYYQLREDHMLRQILDEALLMYPDYLPFREISNLDLNAK